MIVQKKALDRYWSIVQAASEGYAPLDFVYIR